MITLIIDTRSTVPIYEQIMAQIRDGIQQGALAPGQALPSVRQMAADLEINPNTAAKAYLLLEREGVLRSVRRRGSFVAEDAVRRLKRQSDAHLDQALDHILAESDRLGIGTEKLLAGLRRRLADRGSRHPREPRCADEARHDKKGG